MNFKLMINKTGLWAKKHSPELLMGAGILTMVGGCVLASRNTYKRMPYEMKRHYDKLEDIQKTAEENYEEAKKEAGKEFAKHTVEVVKTYAAPMALEAAGATMIFASNNIMRKRVAGITAAFTTVSTAFDTYRKGVIDRYGEDVDRSILLGEKEVEVERTDENGETKKETITVADPDVSSIGRYLTEKNGNFSRSESFMKDVCRMKDAYLTDKLKGKGYLVLNDIYEEYDFPEDTEAGVVVGKVYDPNSNDNYIQTILKEVTIPDEFGNYEKAWYVDWDGLEIIYGKGAGHRSIAN